VKDINALYLLFYGEHDNLKTNRKDVRTFKGFHFDDEEYEAKLNFVTDTVVSFIVEELVKLCAWF